MTNSIKLASKKITLASGTYKGKWSAYIITLDNGVRIETVEGCRSFDGIECTVVVNGTVTATID